MIELVWGCSKNPEIRNALAQWCFDLIDQSLIKQYENCVCLGVVKNGALIGCVVFNDYNPQARTIELTMAAVDRSWVNFRLLEEIRRYCFDQLDLQMIVARTNTKNKHIIRILSNYGFDVFEIPRLFGQNDDGAFMTLTKEQSEKSKIGKRGKRENTVAT